MTQISLRKNKVTNVTHPNVVSIDVGGAWDDSFCKMNPGVGSYIGGGHIRNKEEFTSLQIYTKLQTATDSHLTWQDISVAVSGSFF